MVAVKRKILYLLFSVILIAFMLVGHASLVSGIRILDATCNIPLLFVTFTAGSATVCLLNDTNQLWYLHLPGSVSGSIPVEIHTPFPIGTLLQIPAGAAVPIKISTDFAGNPTIAYWATLTFTLYPS